KEKAIVDVNLAAARQEKAIVDVNLAAAKQVG
ncbi:hypothetical protein A2U01_0086587, partial [Trifolium medium]|nr:hypothetical protein [Trifolium medium]